jgi:putative SOS response-associated peptidase YedK
MDGGSELPDERAPPSFAVLTTAARPPVAAIHDRMPVLLSPEGARRWLLGEPPRAVVPDEVALAARPVSPRVNGTTHDDPACLDPPDEAEVGRQLALF